MQIHFLCYDFTPLNSHAYIRFSPNFISFLSSSGTNQIVSRPGECIPFLNQNRNSNECSNETTKMILKPCKRYLKKISSGAMSVQKYNCTKA